MSYTSLPPFIFDWFSVVAQSALIRVEFPPLATNRKYTPMCQELRVTRHCDSQPQNVMREKIQ